MTTPGVASPTAWPPGITAGVLGLEARHTWWGELGPITLNQLWDDSGNRYVLARPGQPLRPGRAAAAAVYPLTRIQGLHSRTETDDNRAPLTARMGEEIYLSLQRAKTVTYEGTICGATLADLRRAGRHFRQSVSGTAETFMLVQANPLYARVDTALSGPLAGGESTIPVVSSAGIEPGWTVTVYGVVDERIVLAIPDSTSLTLDRFVDNAHETGNPVVAQPPAFAYLGRATQFDLGDEQTATNTAAYGPYQRPFVFAVRQHDPRYYAWRTRSAMNQPVNTPVTVTSYGSAPADPVLTIRPTSGHYLGTTLQIVNNTIGRELHVSGLFAGTGLTLNFLTGINGHVTINFANRTIVNETGYSLLRALDVNLTDWWDAGAMGLAPGNNELVVTGGNAGSFDVQWLDASW
jgi:hypothetical protein